MRRLPLPAFALILAAGLAIATTAAAAPVESPHPNGASISVASIDPKLDSILLAATIANPGDREISLNRARSFILDEGNRRVHRLNPPADNLEMRIPARAQIAAELVFIGPLASSARQVTLSTNAGIGTTDNPHDNLPVFNAVLPVEKAADNKTEYQVSHPDGAFLRVGAVRVGASGCALTLLATNGSDRAIRLDGNNSLVLTDDRDSAFVAEAPADNPEISVPPASRLEGNLKFRCAAIDPGSNLTLSSNRGSGGTSDNPYDTTPVFILRLPTEPAADAATQMTTQLTISPIARTRLLSTGQAIASAAPAPPPLAAATPSDAKPPQPEKPPAKPATPPKLSDLEAALHATQTDRGQRVALPADALFGPAGDAFIDTAWPLLGQLNDLITAARPRDVVIAGNTDSSGNDDDNLKLSQQRAGAVRAWLQQNNGKRPVRFADKGYGRTRPVAPNHNADGSDNPDGRAANRRVEVLLRR